MFFWRIVKSFVWTINPFSRVTLCDKMTRWISFRSLMKVFICLVHVEHIPMYFTPCVVLKWHLSKPMFEHQMEKSQRTFLCGFQTNADSFIAWFLASLQHKLAAVLQRIPPAIFLTKTVTTPSVTSPGFNKWNKLDRLQLLEKQLYLKIKFHVNDESQDLKI